jgi:uncharacterized membrane protein YjgN (DUF898 family)
METENEKRNLTFYGKGGTLFGIHLVNLFLGIFTLGIYFFWARVKVRKYIWGQLEFEGDRFSYHGTGGETLRGWLKAMLIFGVPYFLFSSLPHFMGWASSLALVGRLLALFLLVLFIPMATIGARRYRLSRTAWRGIRFSFQKTWRDFMPIYILGNILKAVTLGIYTPYYDAERDRLLISNTYIGNRNLVYDGVGGDLFRSYFVAFILAIPTLGFTLLWYHVKKTRYVWNHTCFGDARFENTITFGGMFWLYLGNFLMVLFTLGFAFPWAQVRSINYLLANLSLNGRTELGSIQQDAQTVNATGEELSSFLELDFDLG